jgi:uncharacterized protein
VSGNNSRLVAPRRFGKTSLLRRVIEDVRAEGWNAVYVDFFGVLNLADVAIRVERAYDQQLQGAVASWFAGIRRRLKPAFQVGGTPDIPVGVEMTLDPQAEEPVLDRLALPKRLFDRDGTRTLVVFDEFQDVLATKQRADAVIRSEIQHHGDAASYVFAGSQLGMMRTLFADKRRAFFGQAGPVDLEPLDPVDVAEFVASRFEATGKAIGEAIGPLLDTARGHPQRTMLLAHMIWDETPAQATASDEVWESALDSVKRGARDELRAIWLGLSSSQQRVLRAIAFNSEGLYARGSGRTRGGAVKAALDRLRDVGEVAEDRRTRTGYRLVDPLLEMWIRDGTPA